jgi:RNA polymerase-binding transcription factor DksA
MAKKTAKTSKVLKKSATVKGKAVKQTAKPVPRSKKPAVKSPVSAKKPIPSVKRPVGKPVAPTKGVSATKPAPAKAGVHKTESVPVRKSPFDVKVLTQLKDSMIKMLDRLTGQISSQSDDSLKYVDDTSSEDRTDDFDKEFALNLVSSEHDSVFEINNALRRIAEGSYGFCDGCGCVIEKPRLYALPFARMCIRCQSEQEKGRTRFRPFGDTLAQGVEQAPEVSEPEESE